MKTRESNKVKIILKPYQEKLLKEKYYKTFVNQISLKDLRGLQGKLEKAGFNFSLAQLVAQLLGGPSFIPVHLVKVRLNRSKTLEITVRVKGVYLEITTGVEEEFDFNL